MSVLYLEYILAMVAMRLLDVVSAVCVLAKVDWVYVSQSQPR
jgi:hypothetical protein